MKPHHRFVSTALLALALPTFHLHAQSPKPSDDPFLKKPADATAAGAVGNERWAQPILILEVYALDQTDAHEIMEVERGNAARYLRVLALQKNGKARLETLTAMNAKSGQRSVSESSDEVRYPTEFNPSSGKNAIAAPTAWAVRNAGDSLEVELVIGPDGRTIDVNLVPQRVSLVEFRDAAGMAGDHGVSQPVFRTQKVTTSTSLIAGAPHTLGTFSPATDRTLEQAEGAREVWLAFLRANIASPSAQQLQPRAKPLDWSALHFDYTFISLDRRDAREVATAQPALDEPWERMQALLREKKARLEGVVSLATKSGQRALTESVRELRLASEYETPAKASSGETTRHTSTTRPGSDKTQKPQPVDPGKIIEVEETTTVTRTEANAETTPGYATAFETRKTGITVEMEPVVGPDGLSMDLNQVVTMTTHLGALQTTGVAARYPAQPLFETRKITASQSLLAETHQLVGTLNPPGADGVNGRADDGRTWLVFVRVTPNEP